jgi:hypothetical protein
MIPFRVFVAGAPCDIAVHAKPEGDAVAVGEFNGKEIKVRRESAIAAATAWAKAAEAAMTARQEPRASR